MECVGIVGDLPKKEVIGMDLLVVSIPVIIGFAIGFYFGYLFCRVRKGGG